jgi:hypothetical protein
MMLVARDGAIGLVRAAYARMRPRLFADTRGETSRSLSEDLHTRSLDRPVQT